MRELIKDDSVMKCTLDFSNCKNLGEIHNLMKKELKFPDFYGKNLSALWDCVTGMMYTPADITIVYKPTTKQSEDLRNCVLEIIKIFIDALLEWDMILLHIDLV